MQIKAVAAVRWLFEAMASLREIISEVERDAIRVAAEVTPGVRSVNDNLVVQSVAAV